MQTPLDWDVFCDLGLPLVKRENGATPLSLLKPIHLIRFLINEPLPLLRNMSFGIALVGIMIIGCGVLYSRQKKIRATEETT